MNQENTNAIFKSLFCSDDFDIQLTMLVFTVYFLFVVVFLTVFTGFLVVLPGNALQKFFEVAEIVICLNNNLWGSR